MNWIRLFFALLFLVSPALADDTLRVEIRNSEVWLNRNAAATQLTDDGKSKLQAVLSPRKNQIAYYEQCTVTEHCTPSIVILNFNGKRVLSFAPQMQFGPCGSILYIWWLKSTSIAAECHINPSLSEYIETDLATRKVVRDLFGYWFSPSPDATKVAHVGPIIHFAPPFAQSNYLQIDNLVVYPLRKGEKPFPRKPTDEPRLVRGQGLSFFGIHEFQVSPQWAPDMHHVALIDCTYNWTATDNTLTRGTESNHRCSIVAISPGGEFQSRNIPYVDPRVYYRAQLAWVNPRLLTATIEGKAWNIDVRPDPAAAVPHDAQIAH